MALTHDIRIKVTKNQFELIKNNAESDGFKTLSSYIRKKILDDNKIYERLINEIFSKLDKK
ncbi:MAG: hypothetical protein AABW41_03845 [Nanoarchaeota archaeon]